MAPYDSDDDLPTDVLADVDVDTTLDTTNDSSEEEKTSVRRVRDADLSFAHEEDDEKTIVRTGISDADLAAAGRKRSLPRPQTKRPDAAQNRPGPPPAVRSNPLDRGSDTDERKARNPWRARRKVPDEQGDGNIADVLEAAANTVLTDLDDSEHDTAMLDAFPDADGRALPEHDTDPLPAYQPEAEDDPSELETTALPAYQPSPPVADEPPEDQEVPPDGISRVQRDRPDTSEQLRRLGLSRAAPPKSYDPDTTGSGFYSLPVIEDVETVEPRNLRQLLIRGAAASGVVVLIAGLAVLSMTVTQWLTPGEVLVWLAVAVLLPATLLSMVVCWPVKNEAFAVRHGIGAFAPAAIATVLALMGGSLWGVDSLRAGLTGIAPDNVEIARAQLGDDSAVVFQKVCKRIVERHLDPDWRHVAVGAMASRPQEAAVCVAAANEEVREAFAPSLADRWHRHLMSVEAAEDLENACPYASAMSDLPLPRGAVDSRLLNCTLGAESSDIQVCCANVLGSTVSDEAQWVDHIRATIGYVRDDETAEALVAMAFHQKNLTDAQKRLADQVSFTGSEARGVALAFACDTIESGKLGSTRHLAASLEGECPIRTGEIPTARATWSAICDRAMLEIDERPSAKTLDVLCKSSREVLIDDSIKVASSLISFAARSNRGRRLSEEIDLGFARQQAAENERPEFLKRLHRVKSNRSKKRGPRFQHNSNVVADDAFPTVGNQR